MNTNSHRYAALLAACGLLISLGCDQKKDPEVKSQTRRPPVKESNKWARQPSGAVADRPARNGTPLRDVAVDIAVGSSAEAAADWRTALTDTEVSMAIKAATVKQLGEGKITESVPLLLEHLMEITPAFKVSANNWRPCSEALISIGEPALNDTLARFQIEVPSAERFELFHIILTLRGGCMGRAVAQGNPWIGTSR